jgi:hypothetical protein
MARRQLGHQSSRLTITGGPSTPTTGRHALNEGDGVVTVAVVSVRGVHLSPPPHTGIGDA